jgi:hypothetical protein
MEMSFSDFLAKNEQNTFGYHNDGATGAYLSSDQTGSEMSNTMGLDGRPNHLPSSDLSLPSINRSGRVVFIDKKKNPISIHLSDGTRLYLTYAEYKRIKGAEPEMGRTMSVTFQRAGNDNTPYASQVQSITVH